MKCESGKRAFKTELDAKIFMAKLKHDDNIGKDGNYTPIKRTYLCPFCQQWHLTKKEL